MNNPVEEILKLDKAERIKAAAVILNSVADEEDAELTPSQREDLRTRIELYRKGEMEFNSWEDVYNEIRQKLQ
ncbi:MAG: addiction module protein [Chitinophagales bacterium]